MERTGTGVRRLLLSDHFNADDTLIEVRACMKSFRLRDDDSSGTHRLTAAKEGERRPANVVTAKACGCLD